MQKKKKGISLIVLVITIIVILILAATIIISLANNEVINNAQVAVDKTNEKQVQEIANTAWGEAYADGKREVSDLQAAVENALKANNLNPEDYYIQVTEKGVTFKDVNGIWIQKANRTVVKGDTVLKIGDTINYDETNGGTVTGLTNVDWKVLGAENGELLIMSASDIIQKGLNTEETLEGGKQAYENGIAELNALCAPYGKGAYATGARSITIEDIDRVTGYDKTTYGKDTIYEYGNVVTYKYNGTTRPACVGSNEESGILSSTHNNGFHWYDTENGWQSVSTSDLTKAENKGEKIGKTTSTYYYYDVDQKTDLAKGIDAYSMLFGNDNIRYWLASQYAYAYFDCARFGIYRVFDGSIMGLFFVYSNGDCDGRDYGVRAVVSLSPDFNP